MTVSIRAAVSVEASDVPKNAEAYCLTITVSRGRGATSGSISPERGALDEQCQRRDLLDEQPAVGAVRSIRHPGVDHRDAGGAGGREHRVRALDGASGPAGTAANPAAK